MSRDWRQIAWYRTQAESSGQHVEAALATVDLWEDEDDMEWAVFACARLAAHFGRLALGQTKVQDVPETLPDDGSRCAICGWPMGDDKPWLCRRGNCSLRPLPDHFYAPARARAEYAPFLDDDQRVHE